jgi:phenylpropionate dioxygenase-like ring-hydroxylating dioxygenase large terminal subunit
MNTYPFDNQWYVVCTSPEIRRGRKFGIKLHGRNITVWRKQDGSLAAIDARCPHMSASLSLGRVVDDHVECPYHGLLFNDKGECTKVPRQDASIAISPRLCNRSYAVQENDGWVFIFWATKDTPLTELPYFPHITRSKTKLSHVTSWRDWPVNITRAVENTIDVLHFGAVHRGWLSFLIGPIVETSCKIEGNVLYSWQSEKPHATEGGHVQIMYPNLWLQWLHPKFIIMIAAVPLDENTTRLYLRSSQGLITWPIIGWLLAGFRHLLDVFALWQDSRIVASQIPNNSDNIKTETLLRADSAVAQYRKMRKQFAPKSDAINVSEDE